MRDYEKYIARQLKRGTSRQELNISWLKKNELDLKRHVQDLRDNIRNNWATTGQELSRELRQYWPTSRPQSPAPLGRFAQNGEHPTSPTGPSGVSSLAKSPTHASIIGDRSGNITNNEFITGYTLGLIGSVRSWVSCPRAYETVVSISWASASLSKVTVGLSEDLSLTITPPTDDQEQANSLGGQQSPPKR